MKGQRVRGELERIGNGAGGHAVSPGLDQEAKYVEAIVLGQRRQGRQHVDLFHISISIEIFARRQDIFQHLLK
jgi:hypothetical protein